MDVMIVDSYMINTFCIMSIILLVSISTFQYIKDSQAIIYDINIETFIQRLSYLFISYILIFQAGILYHVNNLDYYISGSESEILITENENTNPMITLIILISIIISLVITYLSVKNDNQMIQINKDDINI